MKKLVKDILGRMLLGIVKHPIGYACLAGQGYYCVEDEAYKSMGKLMDIRSLPYFGEKAKIVVDSGRSCLGYERLFNLYQVLVGRKDLTVVEAGVYKGGSSYFMASIMDGGRLYCFDTFEGHDGEDISDNDNLHKAGMFDDTDYEDVKKYLAEFENVTVVKGRIQDTATLLVAETVDVVHLDMDIYTPTVWALDYFDKRMSPGGIFILDDYGFITCHGARVAVDEFMSKHDDYIKIYLQTGQMMLIKRDVDE